MGKESTYFDEAERLYTFGRTLEEIAAMLPVSMASLSKWCHKGGWKEKRKAAMGSTRTVAETLREVLRLKVQKVVGKGDLDYGEADEIAKISATIERMERGSYNFLAAAVEVMGRFTEFLRAESRDPEELRRWSEKIQAWFKSLE